MSSEYHLLENGQALNKQSAIDKLVNELELTRLELSVITHNNNNNLLSEEVLKISQKLDALVVQYLHILYGKDGGR